MRVLREVVTSGSFSAAADALHLSQSAVSQQVAALEREVGLQLLERTSEGPRLTPAGERLVEHADAVITRLGEAERELAEIAGLEGGRLRLVSFPTASATLMTQAMSELRRRHPRIELHFAEGESEDSVPAVKRGDYDLALAFDFVAFPEDFGRDTDSELIFTDPMRVALPPGHPLAQMETVDLSALADEEWLCGEAPSSCRAHVINACRAAGWAALRAPHLVRERRLPGDPGPGRRGARGGPDSRACPARPRGRPARHRARPADPSRLGRHPLGRDAVGRGGRNARNPA